MKIKFFYGWYIVVAGLLLNVYNASLFAYGWSAFVNPIVATFGWTMVQLSLASSLRGVESGIFNPIFGWIVDRFSARKLMVIGIIVNAAGVFLLSQTKNLVMYYCGFLIMGLGSSMAMGILPAAVLARWFKKDLGKANGIFYMGNGIGGLAAPLIVKIIDSIGWQATLFYGAIGLLVIGLPIALIFRSRPQDYNLLPDGVVSVDSSGAKVTTDRTEHGVNVREALKMRAFWHLVIVALFQSSFMGVLTTFSIPYLTNIGMTRPAAATVTTLFTLASLFTRIPFGMLSDKIRKSYCVAISTGFLTLGALLFWLLIGSSPLWMKLLFAIFYGVGLSGIMVLQPPIIVEYFGTKNFGTIFALQGIFLTIAGIATQPLTGWVFDTYNTYKPLWLGFAIFGVVALAVILTIPRAKSRIEPASEAISTKTNK